jgi:hypothetical protein
MLMDVHSVQGGMDGRRADLDGDQRIEAPYSSFKGSEAQILIGEYTVTGRVIVYAQSDASLPTDEYGGAQRREQWSDLDVLF